MTTQKISIITPAFGQLDWLRLCVASVADQVGVQYEGAKVKGAVTDAKQRPGQQKVGMAESKVDGRTSMARGVDSEGSQVSGFKLQVSQSHGFAVEHIIQDGGTPGIEEFAKEMAEG